MFTTQALPVSINAFTSDHWMWGAQICRIYACVGAIFGKSNLRNENFIELLMLTKFFSGTESLLTLVVIGYDRYNVIVKGMTGFKMTYGVALLVLLSTWVWVVLVSVPPFFGWGGYSLGENDISLVFWYEL